MIPTDPREQRKALLRWAEIADTAFQGDWNECSLLHSFGDRLANDLRETAVEMERLQRSEELLKRWVDSLNGATPPSEVAELCGHLRGVAHSLHEFDHNCPICLNGRIAELEQQLGFWMGEGQEDRPEIIEYQTLLNRDRTPDEDARLREIAQQIQIDSEEAPELRARISELLQARPATTETR